MNFIYKEMERVKGIAEIFCVPQATVLIEFYECLNEQILILCTVMCAILCTLLPAKAVILSNKLCGKLECTTAFFLH